jgi:carboxylesterase
VANSGPIGGGEASLAPAPLPTSNEPELLRAGSRGSLLIHGFTGCPWEMRFLGEHLQAAGITANIIRLAGHATSPEDMEGFAWQDWYGSALAGLDALAQVTDDIVVVGQSMGSLLALKLAAEHPERIRALVLLAPALKTSMFWLPWVTPLIPVVRIAFGERFRFVSKEGGSDVADDAARATIPSYTRTPLRAVNQLVQLQQNVRPLVASVRQPTLIVHSTQDHTCPIENVALLQKELPGPVRTLILRDSFHVVSIDKDRELVAAEVAAFISGGAAVAC